MPFEQLRLLPSILEHVLLHNMVAAVNIAFLLVPGDLGEGKSSGP